MGVFFLTRNKDDPMDDKYRDRLVKNLRSAGKTIVDNAEVMSGCYKHQTGDLIIRIRILVLCQDLAQIKMRNFSGY